MVAGIFSSLPPTLAAIDGRDLDRRRDRGVYGRSAQINVVCAKKVFAQIGTILFDNLEGFIAMLATNDADRPHGDYHQRSIAMADEHVAFIAASSLILLMSNSPDAAPDVSPRGDAPGFVHLIDRNRLHIPDRIGNNRLDTMQNLLTEPHLAVVFMRKGDDRVLIIHCSATISTDPKLLSEFEYKGRAPRSVMEIAIQSAALTAPTAFAASGFWEAVGADRAGTVASLGEILADQVGGMTKDEGEAFIANSYQNKLY